MQRITPRNAALTALASIGLVGGLFISPAAAKGQDTAPGQEKQTDAASAPAFTEDNDTNDGGTPNNVADSGDNAHPSGKDRSVEHGRSGNQGKATSDPDDDGRGPDRSNGGPDKPNGSGGVDKADQDGNNGCGNDDDFEDDNEGWCGRRPAKAKPAPVKPEQPKAEKPARPAAQPKAEQPKDKPAKPEQPKAEQPKGKSADKPAKGEKPAKGGRPAKPGKPGKGTNVDGKGTAAITVVAECSSVTVSSSKDISHVVVRFVDGSSVKFDGLRGKTWSRSFSKEVASATAKSATTRVTDMASCGGTTGDVGGVETTTPAPVEGGSSTCPTGMVDTNGTAAGGCALPGSAEVPCPAGTIDTNGDMPAGCETPGGDVAGGGATVDRPAQGEVLAGGAAKGGPSDGTVSARGAGAAVTAALGSAVGSALAFTGSNTIVLLAIALGLLGAGLVLVRTSRRRAEATID